MILPRNHTDALKSPTDQLTIKNSEAVRRCPRSQSITPEMNGAVVHLADYVRLEDSNKEDPFERVLARMRAHGCKYQVRSADSVRSQCPAHDDKKPSLLVTRNEDRVVVKCFAGCAKAKVLGRSICDTRICITAGARRPRNADHRGVSVPQDEDGNVIAEKVRFEPKALSWRTPDGKPGLHGRVVGLYHLPDLVDARQVFVVEGEKAVERLCELGFTATCPPAGAGNWPDTYADILWKIGAAEVVILPMPINRVVVTPNVSRIPATGVRLLLGATIALSENPGVHGPLLASQTPTSRP